MQRRGVRIQLSLPALSVFALFLSIFSPISLTQATATPAFVTCVNLQTGTERISHTGKCRYTQEAQANWHKNSTDSPIASGTNAKVIVICSNKESSPVSYQVIRKKCARHQITTVFSRSGSLPAKPVITEAVSFGHDSASLKLLTDPAGSTDAPIAFYTITSTTVDTRTPIMVHSQKIYYWKDLGIAINTLQASTRYTFTVSATNADGTSQLSLASLPVTTLAYVPPASTASSSSIAVPVFTLSSTTEVKTVNNAITGYTITSTGGTIASFAISPATPAGMNFNAVTGILSGTPTSTQIATTYTITATNASGTSTATFTLTVSSSATNLSLSRASVGNTTGIAFTTQPQITIQDADNNTVTTSSQTVTATISTGGALVGTKTAVATSGVATFTNLGIRGWGNTSYTITYSVPGLASATQSVTTSSAYLVGATGPGGGVIYYRNSSGWTCGPALDEKCYYLEVAPPALGLASWDTDTVNSVSRTWAQTPHQTTAVPNFGDRTNAQSIGYGYRNTLLIINQGNSDSSTSAAALAQSFRGGGFSDWFLPARDEGYKLCEWHQASGCSGNAAVDQNQAAAAAGFVRGPYWTSSESDSTIAYSRENRQGGHQGGITKSSTALVRPIRAF